MTNPTPEQINTATEQIRGKPLLGEDGKLAKLVSDVKALQDAKKHSENLYSSNPTGEESAINYFTKQSGQVIEYSNRETTRAISNRVVAIKANEALGYFGEFGSEMAWAVADGTIADEAVRNSKMEGLAGILMAVKPMEHEGDDAHNETVSRHKKFAKYAGILGKLSDESEEPVSDREKAAMANEAAQEADRAMSLETNPQNKYIPNELREDWINLTRKQVYSSKAVLERYVAGKAGKAKAGLDERFANTQDRARYVARNIELINASDDLAAREAAMYAFNAKVAKD